MNCGLNILDWFVFCLLLFLAYTKGDNSKVVPTDTVKNTIYVLAKRHMDTFCIEEFALVIARHFVSEYSHVNFARVKNNNDKKKKKSLSNIYKYFGDFHNDKSFVYLDLLLKPWSFLTSCNLQPLSLFKMIRFPLLSTIGRDSQITTTMHLFVVQTKYKRLKLLTTRTASSLSNPEFLT